MARKITSFAILNHGQEIEAFRVEEDREKGLRFLFQIHVTTFGGDGTQGCRDLHFSAHAKKPHGVDKKLRHKIKYSMLNSEKILYDESIIIEDKNDNGLVWPMINILSDAAIGPPILENDSADIVRLVGFNSPYETITYTIYVHLSSIEMPTVQGFAKYTHRYTEMAVSVYCSFLNVPSSSFSVWMPPVIGVLRKAGEKADGQNEQFRPVMTAKGVETRLQDLHRKNAKHYIELINVDFVSKGQKRVIYDDSLFHKYPIFSNNDHREYGEMSEKKLGLYFSPTFTDGTPKPAGYINPRGPLFREEK